MWVNTAVMTRGRHKLLQPRPHHRRCEIRMQFDLQDLAFVCEDSSVVKNIEDDLEREAVFATQALQTAVKARRLMIAAGLPFERPPTLQAQMLKTVEQMSRISRTHEEALKVDKLREDAKKQRINRKMGKQIQVAREQEKSKKRTEETKRLDMMRKKRTGTDDFEIDIDGQDKPKDGRKGRRSLTASKPGVSQKREARNERYGSGGKKRGLKRNSKESTDVDSFDPRSNRASFSKSFGKKGGNRPGKQRRQDARSKKASRRN